MFWRKIGALTALTVVGLASVAPQGAYAAQAAPSPKSALTLTTSASEATRDYAPDLNFPKLAVYKWQVTASVLNNSRQAVSNVKIVNYSIAGEVNFIKLVRTPYLNNRRTGHVNNTEVDIDKIPAGVTETIIWNFSSAAKSESSSTRITQLNAGLQRATSPTTTNFHAYTWLALGDSYASGEGVNNEHMFRETNAKKTYCHQVMERTVCGLKKTGRNYCHRSALAASLVAGQAIGYQTATAACSGAIVRDFYQPNSSDNHGSNRALEPAQQQFITPDLKVVTVSFGGNDIGFGDIATTCFYPFNPLHTLYTCEKAINEAYEKITITAATVRTVLESVAISAKHAKIIDVGYPSLVEKNDSVASCHVSLLDGKDVTSAEHRDSYLDIDDVLRRLRKLQNDLNSAIQVQISGLQTTYGNRITHTRENSTFDGHGICASEENTFFVKPTKMNLFNPAYGPLGQNLLHPNARGQAALQQLIINAVQSSADPHVDATVAVGDHPMGLAFSPDGTKAYVTNNGSNSVSVIAAATGVVSSTIAVGLAPQGVAFTPDGTKAYVANFQGGSVSVIDVAKNLTGTPIQVGNYPYAVAISPDGTKVYVTKMEQRVVAVIDVATGTVTKTIEVGAHPMGVAFSPNGTKAYVTNLDDNSMSVIDVATGVAGKTLAVGRNPRSVAFSPDGKQAYVTNFDDASVSVIDVATEVVRTKTIPAGENPYAVAFSPDGKQAYVTNFQGSSVSVIDVATGKRIGLPVMVGQGPEAVAFNPRGTQAYVANTGGRSVSVITVAPTEGPRRSVKLS